MQIVDAAVEQLTKQEVWTKRGFSGFAPGRNNQDAVGCFKTDGIFAVAGGIASRPHSELAAKALIGSFASIMGGMVYLLQLERIQDGMIERRLWSMLTML